MLVVCREIWKVLVVSLGLGCVVEAGVVVAPERLGLTGRIREFLVSEAKRRGAQGGEGYEEVLRLDDAKEVRFRMVGVPAGEFLMGTEVGEVGRRGDEGPQRRVVLDGFWMGETEVTWGMYRPFMESEVARNKDGSRDLDGDVKTAEKEPEGAAMVDAVTQPTPPYTPMHGNMGDGDYGVRYPAVGMTQRAAGQFCQWLSVRTGRFYRLATEAEWEYAARAGGAGAYGGVEERDLEGVAWFAKNAQFQYQKVGLKKANGFGLYDMLGNVAELCWDQYRGDAYGRWEDRVRNPRERVVARYPTVFRGGSWKDDAVELRCGARGFTTPGLKAQDPQFPKSLWYFTSAPWLGLRVVHPREIPSVEEMHEAWYADGLDESVLPAGK